MPVPVSSRQKAPSGPVKENQIEEFKEPIRRGSIPPAGLKEKRTDPDELFSGRAFIKSGFVVIITTRNNVEEFFR